MGALIQQSKRIILTIIIACQLMIVLDASIMITALPEIGRSLHLTTTNLTWVQNAYILAFGGFLLLGARAGDILGRRRIFMTGITLFTLASLLAGLSQSAEWLLVTRALQGIAAALAAPSTLALLSVSFVEAKERSKAIALYSAVSGAGGSVGLVLGGVLTDLISWRFGMFINVPIGVALLLLAPRYLSETDRNTGRFDLTGALSSVIGMTALVFGFVHAASSGWANIWTLVSIIAGVASLIAFFLIEARAEQPITPLRLFASHERSGSYLGRLLFVGGMFSMIFFLSQFLQRVLGFSSFQAGLAFLPMTAVQFAMMYLMPWLTSRFGPIRLLVSGIIIAIAGMGWLSRITIESQFFPQIFIPMVILGIGAGIVFIPFTSFGLAGVDKRDAGAASGLVNVAHQIGGSIGLAILITFFERAIGKGTISSKGGSLELAHAVSISITGSVIFLTLSLVVVLLLLYPSRATIKNG
ncbi:MFS transporter [Bacillus sp. FJAT-26390]|uniref:MFS transporter n=1 Tax=Bacillus sp. FJAT-26390 TaxID=1743142 RepID=UPI0020FFF8BB|nr:MFS transporter [Bacillus sp. FJAT-26390]